MPVQVKLASRVGIGEELDELSLYGNRKEEDVKGGCVAREKRPCSSVQTAASLKETSPLFWHYLGPRNMSKFTLMSICLSLPSFPLTVVQIPASGYLPPLAHHILGLCC
jgi:hypothetical protein